MNDVVNGMLVVMAGALLCNAIPHLASGLRGERFPTPFAKPRGVGLSSPLTNMLWGAGNLFLGSFATIYHAPPLGRPLAMLLLAIGFVAIGTHLALHFGKVRADQTDR